MLLRSLLLTALIIPVFAIPVFAGEATLVDGHGPDPGIFATPLLSSDLAPAGDVEWLDGKTVVIESMDKEFHKVLWTRTKGIPRFSQGITYGAGPSTGVRHLRLAFARQLAIGSVFAAGDGRLSVLKPGVEGWGDPGDDTQWLAAESLDGRSVTGDEPRAPLSRGKRNRTFTLWVLPPGCSTKALRFSHQPELTDDKYAGNLGGVYLLSGRYANLAPQARVAVSSGARSAQRLINGRDDGWSFWNNGAEGAEVPVTRERPVDIVLAFPAPVVLRGLATLACGADAAELSALPGAGGAMPGFNDPAWKPLREVKGMLDWFGWLLRSNWLDLGADASLCSLRLRLIAGPNPYMSGPNTKGGKRVTLDEVIALMPLGDRPLASAVLPAWPEQTAHPPIAVPFHLAEPGNVTLVIENQDGKRIRNLCAETPFPAGDNTTWWDGLDDLGRDVQASRHGLYHIPGTLVAPGTYRVRGLAGPEVSLRYEFSPDDAGEPPWPTADNTGGWGTNHTPPSCAAFAPADRTTLNVPLVFIGSYIAEGGHGLFWVDPDGRKRGGLGWVGGMWTGAQTLAADSGPKPVTDTAVYVASGFHGEVRFTSLNRELREAGIVKLALVTRSDAKDRDGPTAAALPVVLDSDLEPKTLSDLCDLAARDGLLAATLPAINELWLVDAPAKRLVARVPLPDPGGVVFAADGALLATSADQLVRLDLPGLAQARTATGPAAVIQPGIRVIVRGLDKPHDLGLLPDGNLTVSEWGARHQVRVLRPDGTVVRSIGKAGPPRIGSYDPLHLNRPAGVAADDRGRLWITEANTQPKRVGLWDAAGTLQRAWYGPSRYGGGGTLDGFDRTLFYNYGMAFRLDWKTGTLALERILWIAPHTDDGERQQFPPDGMFLDGMPECPHRVNGRHFFSNWHNSNPCQGANLVTVWEDRDGALKPIAAMGDVGWKLLRTPAFAGSWPAGALEAKPSPKLWCSWTDANGDGVMQPGEVKIRPGSSGGVTVQPDLSFVCRLDDKIVRIPATVGAGPVSWAFDAPETLLEGGQGQASSGGGTNLLTADRRVFAYPPPKPFSPYSVGSADWSYPNMWPGLHPSHESPVPDRPGELIGPTRLLGHDVTPRGGEAGPLVLLNQNMGTIAVFTSDGLMVATLFHDVRTAMHWAMPVRTRDMDVSHLSLHDECFWPNVTQCQDDGRIYLSVGGSLVRVGGLERIRRLPARDLMVDAALIARCTAWQAELERERQARIAPRTITVPIAAAPVLDGDLADWTGADWATIDERGQGAWFNSNTKPYAVFGSLRIAGDRLYAAWRTTEGDLAVNTAEVPTAPFKTGSALDLMLGTDPTAKADRRNPVPGDLRLLITRQPDGKDGKKMKTWAVLYRAVVPGTANNAKVPFSSPWRTITFDAVTDISPMVELAQKEGDYEISVPLAILGLKPVAGQRLRGDLGVLRGSGGMTTQRIYWSNKATGITADVPSEAQLQPELWGTFELR